MNKNNFLGKMVMILTIGFLTALPKESKANIYLEPYIGYETGKYKDVSTVTSPAGDAGSYSTSVTSSGVDFGAKLGYSFLLLAVGADYMGGSGKISLLNATSSATSSDIGAFVNVKLPLIKLSATYFISSQLKGGNATVKGNGIKAGVGFTGLPFVSLNVDVISIKYDKITPTNSDVYSNIGDTRSTVLASVSMPFDF